MAFRKRESRSSRRRFGRSSRRTHVKNLRAHPMRGGIRL